MKRRVLRYCPTCLVWWWRRGHVRSWCPKCATLLEDRPLPPAPEVIRPNVRPEWSGEGHDDTGTGARA